MYQPSAFTPIKHTKKQSNPKNIDTEINLSDVITDDIPLVVVPGHATPIRKARKSSSRKGNPSKVSSSYSPSMAARNVKILEPSTAVKKPHYMTSLYLDPINVEPNVGASEECLIMPNFMEDVEASKTSNKPRSITTLSKSIMIVADRDDVDKNIRVLISQILGIKPKTGVVLDVSTSLTQPNNTTETPLDKSDVNVSTLSPEKLKDKEESDGMSGDLADKEENSLEKKDQSTNIVNIEDLDYDDVPIGQRLAPGIAKRLKNTKGQAIKSSNTPSKSLKRRTNVDPTKIWSKVVTPVSNKKSLKRKEFPSESSESDHDVEHNIQDIVSIARKQASGKKIPANIPEDPIDKIYFHYMENVEK
ncbi:uncharacterized protein LOC127091990 [Lathyrus oleraceus]|uniref:uncharacterized protein LOC127091990 n=1 Tax=Pisum sativum TaxID=3888 RepID=UPI0021D16422|nr:uncharacterized protein LOC127091990 [Pisum sativum]